MIQKLKILTICFAFLSLTAIIPRAQGGMPEVTVRDDAYRKLRELSCGQVQYQESHSGQSYPYCPGSACWNSSSIVGSTTDLENTLGISLTVSNGSNGGDIRFRCRYQNNATYCFAFRCTDLEPAGCDQKFWRLQVTPNSNCELGTECSPPYTCTPVAGSTVCSDVGGMIEIYTCN